MGLTLGRLIIFDYNITKNDDESIYISSGSIDFAKKDPVEKANEEVPYDALLEQSKWNKEDLVVRIVTVPCVFEPQGFVHNNDHYKVTLECEDNNLSKISIKKVYIFDENTNETKVFEKEIVLEFDQTQEDYCQNDCCHSENSDCCHSENSECSNDSEGDEHCNHLGNIKFSEDTSDSEEDSNSDYHDSGEDDDPNVNENDDPNINVQTNK